jgi:hypothetical protein
LQNFSCSDGNSACYLPSSSRCSRSPASIAATTPTSAPASATGAKGLNRNRAGTRRGERLGARCIEDLCQCRAPSPGACSDAAWRAVPLRDALASAAALAAAMRTPTLSFLACFAFPAAGAAATRFGCC